MIYWRPTPTTKAQNLSVICHCLADHRQCRLVDKISVDNVTSGLVRQLQGL